MVFDVFAQYIPPQSLEEQWDVAALEEDLKKDFGLELPVQDWLTSDENLHEETLRAKIKLTVDELFQSKEDRVSAEAMRHFEKSVMLKVLDDQWKEHLANMDHLRQGIGLRGYAQKNPKQEYKRESFEMFTAMLDSVKFDVISLLARFHIPTPEEMAAIEEQRRKEQAQKYASYIAQGDAGQGADSDGDQEAASADGGGSRTRSVSPSRVKATTKRKRGGQEGAPGETYTRSGEKVGRNSPCPCGSGKKYKQCHGKLG